MADTVKFVCTKCEKPKRKKDFGHRNRVRNKRCLACCAEAVRKTYAKSASYRASSRAGHERVALENTVYVFHYLLAHPCIDCGESDPLVLEFDHVEPRDKQQNITAMMSCSRKRIEEEIALCVVRCANCHRRKTMQERNSVRYQLSLSADLVVLVRRSIPKVDRRRKMAA